ncbi:RICIN domain-containing protein [Nonomuraea sp. NPDC050540]|uniref:RICIN domain-containing protein n=1 Tax=Nonomuraea sp. NPDC050540 TaxID=3364367 RepID=UPI003793E6DB
MTRKLVSALFLVAAMLVALPQAGSASARSTDPHWGPALYQNKHSGRCLGVQGPSQSDGALILQWGCNTWDPNSDHRWFLEPVPGSPGFFIIFNGRSGKCLAVPGGTHAPNTQLIQWPCDARIRDHRWRFQQYADGRYQIINYHTGQCVAVRDAKLGDGAEVIQWPCGDHPDHFWAVVPWS